MKVSQQIIAILESALRNPCRSDVDAAIARVLTLLRQNTPVTPEKEKVFTKVKDHEVRWVRSLCMLQDLPEPWPVQGGWQWISHAAYAALIECRKGEGCGVAPVKE